jgi:hypothetical protein
MSVPRRGAEAGGRGSLASRHGPTGRRLRAALATGGVAALLLAGTASAATTTWVRQQLIRDPAHTAHDAFGVSVSLSGDGRTAIVGAPGTKSDSGSVSLFTRVGAEWNRQGPSIRDPHKTALDIFGVSVALSTNGTTAVVGAPGIGLGPNAGSVSIVTRTGATWTQQGPSIPDPAHTAQDGFGNSVAISSDGNTALVGASAAGSDGAGSVSIYTRSGTTWTLQQTITDPAHTAGDDFGASVALSGDGNTALVGAAFANTFEGSVSIFTRSGAAWTLQRTITDSHGGFFDSFGSSVTLSENGNTALVGAPGVNASNGSVSVFTRSGTKWSRRQIISAPDPFGGFGPFGNEFGGSVALSGDGNTALVGAPGTYGLTGAVSIFTRSGTKWIRRQTISDPADTSGDGFGGSVAISSDGHAVMMGEPPIDREAGAIFSYSRVVVAPIPKLVTHWTLAQRRVTVLITPRTGAHRYTLVAARRGAKSRSGVCTLTRTGTTRKVRCVVSLTPGTWTLTAQAHSTTRVIAQATHAVRVR